MSALTVIDTNLSKGNLQKLETLAITAAATTTVTKAIWVPQLYGKPATNAMFVLDLTIASTTPLFDFNVKGVNVANNATPDSGDVFLLGSSWVGITQLTTDGSSPMVTITLGPNIPTDNTGSATVDSAYGVSTPLPPCLAYVYTYDGTSATETYTGSISVYWS